VRRERAARRVVLLLLGVLPGCGFDRALLSSAPGLAQDAAANDRGNDASDADLEAPPDASADASPDASSSAGADGGSRGSASGVFAGQYFTCALVAGQGWCFGGNVDGALGSGDEQTHTSPAPVATTVSFDAMTAGDNHTCALEHGSGAVYCWGYNASGQLGLGDTTTRTVPTRVSVPPQARVIAAGYDHTCAIGTDGSLWCWGDNTEGQLGQNDATGAPNAPSPVRVGTRTDWLDVSGGQGHTCAIEAPGTMWCWGRNSQSETGTDATDVQVRSPRQVGAFTDWVGLDVGQDASCGIRSDGSLWCWGDNSFGQLGAPPSTQAVAMPARVGSDANFAQISVDTFSACALKTDGSIACWGRNAEGQLGLGDTDDRYAPTQVGTLTTWVAVSVGRFHSCFDANDGRVYCSGDNSAGQLGVGDTARRNVPTPVTF
jgi:alpha-tubulin suppressor-like RCC1 family protein